MQLRCQQLNFDYFINPFYLNDVLVLRDVGCVLFFFAHYFDALFFLY